MLAPARLMAVSRSRMTASWSNQPFSGGFDHRNRNIYSRFISTWTIKRDACRKFEKKLKMSFKKLNIPLKEALERLEIENPLPFQEQILPKIKSGANLFGIAPEGAGKTTALVIGTLQKLGSAAFEDAPRALIMVNDKEAALALEKRFQEFTRYMDLRIYSAFEKVDIETQKGDIYEGVDIVISTPERLNKLLSLTGINVGELKLFIVEDAEFLMASNEFKSLIRIPVHLSNCQYVVFSSEFNPKIERLKDTFMAHSQIIQGK